MLIYQPNQKCHKICSYSYLWSSCYKLIDIIVAECQEETSISSNQFVSSITVDGSSLDSDSINDLFAFNNIATSYCPSDSIFPLPPTLVPLPTLPPPPPTNIPRPFNMTISFSSPVLLTMIGIHGDQSNGFVNNFSLSFSEDGTNFNEYTRDTGSVVCCINNNYTYSMIGYQLL